MDCANAVCPLKAGPRCAYATWMRQTPAVAKRTPTKAVTALAHFHSVGSIRSISKIPSAKRVSRMMGNPKR